MRFSRRHRTWVKWLLIIVLLRFIIGGIFYYIVAYRFKDVVQFAVNKESHGAYAFEAADIKYSLWKKDLIIRKAVLKCLDTLHAPYHYDLEVPEVYVKIQSWEDLLFHGKVSVDSISIVSPHLEARAHKKVDAGPAGFHPSLLFDMLQKLSGRLQIRALTLRNGSFLYQGNHRRAPFHSDHINLLVTNFSKKNGREGRLLSSGNIDLSVSGQRWKLPDGIHEISFDKLHFSAKDHYFELDSFRLHTVLGGKINVMLLSADKLFFNSTQLSAVYKKEQLLIDTLVLYRPVLNLQTNYVQAARDSASMLGQALHQVLTGMNFKYIDIRGGRFLLNDTTKGKLTYSTQKMDLHVFNLWVKPGSKYVSTDSIRLKLNELKFITSDSLYQINIDELTLDHQNALLRSAVFGPTPSNHERTLSFQAPLLRLDRVNISDLVNKKLHATAAELVDPVIVLTGKKKPKKGGGHMGNFYKALHGLRELIAVHDFDILNGTVHYQSAGDARLRIDMAQIDSHILLDHFLTSDSLIDIKRSLPELTIRDIAVQSGKIKLHIDHYHFEGMDRQNEAGNFSLDLADSTVISGRGVTWQVLDWDLWQKLKQIQLKALQVQVLTIDRKASRNAKQGTDAKNLPVIRIGNLDLSRLYYNGQTGDGGNIGFDGENIRIDSIASKAHFFTWNQAVGDLAHFRLQNPKMLLQAQSLHFDNRQETVVKNAALEIHNDHGYTYITAPSLTVRVGLQASHFSVLPVRGLVVENPQVEIHRNGIKGGGDQAFSLPFSLELDEGEIKNAAIRYIRFGEGVSDTLLASVNLRLEGWKMPRQPDHLFTYEKASLAVSGLQFHNDRLQLEIPASSLVLHDGRLENAPKGDLSLSSQLSFTGSEARLDTRHPHHLRWTAGKLTGSVPDLQLSVTSGEPVAWHSLVDETALQGENIHLTAPRWKAATETLRWDPFQKTLQAGRFSLLPTISLETELQTSFWQKDYITVNGKAIEAHGVQWRHSPDDSTLIIRKLLLDNVSVSATRDKRKPFEHGIEKKMPTKLIAMLPFPLRIDSVQLKQNAVLVKETSARTGKTGIIPIDQLDATITHFTNRSASRDSLTIRAGARLFDSYIRDFYYREAYGDSLSGFRLRVHASPMKLPEYSQVTAPLAAMSVERGRADTLFAEWSGNKYGASGTMHFYYNGLRLRLLNVNDSTRKPLLLALENQLTNGVVINRKNNRAAPIFFARDREKFVFNYWVKTLLRGVLSSVGVGRDRKYEKEHEDLRRLYAVPGPSEQPRHKTR